MKIIFKICKINKLLLTIKRYILIVKPDLRTWMRRLQHEKNNGCG